MDQRNVLHRRENKHSLDGLDGLELIDAKGTLW